MGIYVLKLPDVGEGIAEAEIVEWNVKPGDMIREDDILGSVMTDKATVEISSPVAGKVISLGAKIGDLMAVGSEMVRFEVTGEGNLREGDDTAAVASPAAESRTTAEPAVDTQARPAAAPLAAPSGQGIYVFKLPDVGEGIAEAEIASWAVKIGDMIGEDDMLVAVMTDKATVEISSPVAGKVVWLAGEAGTTVAIGSDLVRLEVEGAGHPPADAPPASAPAPEKAEPPPSPSLAPPPAPLKPVSKPSAAPAPARAAPPRAGLPRPEGEKPIASPAVRRRARGMGVDLRYVHGTGPAGRITHQDLDDYAAGVQAPAVTARGRGLVVDTSVEEIAVIGLRRKIAAKMQEAKRRIPHITYVEEIDVTEVESLRAHMNEARRSDQPKLTLLPFLMRAIVVGLRNFPKMSAHFDDEAGIVRQYGAAHIGVAAQTPTGLVVPVVKHAEARDIWECASEVKRLADAARDGKATRDELSGSTITITSLGAMGGLATTPVINHPEVAIIGVNKIRVQPVYQDGGFVPRKIMNLSSSFDHRVIDGWDAAAFVQRIKTLLEHPATIFMEA